MTKIIAIIFLIFSINTSATVAEFCHGFSEGYKSIKGNMMMVPMCPMKPITPIGSTDFREGIKAGIAAAYRS